MGHDAGSHADAITGPELERALADLAAFDPELERALADLAAPDPELERALAELSRAPMPVTDDADQLSLADALAAAEHNTFTPHRDVVLDAIDQLAAEGREFSCDDVLDRAGLDQPIGGTGSMGAIFAGAIGRGTIVPVGFVRSRRASRNGGWNRTYTGAR